MAQQRTRKRNVRIKRHLHRLHCYGTSEKRRSGWARNQAARRAGRRRKNEKSGYSM